MAKSYTKAREHRKYTYVCFAQLTSHIAQRTMENNNKIELDSNKKIIIVRAFMFHPFIVMIFK